MYTRTLPQIYKDWKIVCRPKDQGGLGFKPLREWNEGTVDKSDSWSWRIMVDLRDKMKPFVSVVIGDGKDTSVWYDSWNGNKALASVISKKDIYDARFCNKAVVADMIKNALHNRLQTQERMAKWYTHGALLCRLCTNCQDSIKHLFFQCQFSVKVWSYIKGELDVQRAPNDCQLIIQMMIQDMCNDSIKGVLGRIGVAACVYFIWRERNSRIFQKVKMKEEDIISCIKEEIKWKLLSLKVKDTDSVRKVFRK
ncbi:reverse transcriptase domain, reverse transcriptase zinc-binding domain protein [Tanacetum coccineum]